MNVTSSSSNNDSRIGLLSRYSELSPLFSGFREDTTLSLWTPSIFDRDTLAWVGGSLFGGIKGNNSRYILREEYLSSQTRVLTKYHEEDTSPITHQQCRVPDWMSLDAIDWRFYGSLDLHPAPHTATKIIPTKGPWTLLKSKHRLKASTS